MARPIWELDDLGVASEQHKIMCGSGRHRKAIPERHRSTCLETSDLDHPGSPGKIQRERGSQVPQCLVSRIPSLVALYAIVDLNKVHPAR